MSCPECFSGHVDYGTPLGRIEKVHGRETYIAEPPNGKTPKGIVIILHDAFGMIFKNNQILADHYAAAGQYLVYLPDFMDGGSPGFQRLFLLTTSIGRPAPVDLLPVMNNLTDYNDSWLWKPSVTSRVLSLS